MTVEATSRLTYTRAFFEAFEDVALQSARVVVPIVAAALIIGGLLFAWFTFVSHRGPELPPSIGGYQRINDEVAKANAHEIQTALGKVGFKSLSGEYGRSGKDFSLTVFEDPSPQSISTVHGLPSASINEPRLNAARLPSTDC